MTLTRHTQHRHRPIGGAGRIVSPVAIANTETVAVAASLIADTLVAGSCIRIRAVGRITTGATPGSSIFRCRIGNTTLTGNIAATLTLVNGTLVTDAPFSVDILVTIRTAGGGGTAIGNIEVSGGIVGAFTVAGAISAISATVAVATNSFNFVELTYISGNAGSTATFENAIVEAT